jgi:hypothetical protein
MSTEALRADILEQMKLKGIVPWRIDANQHDERGLDECGCAFCPDDEQEPI